MASPHSYAGPDAWPIPIEDNFSLTLGVVCLIGLLLNLYFYLYPKALQSLKHVFEAVVSTLTPLTYLANKPPTNVAPMPHCEYMQVDYFKVNN